MREMISTKGLPSQWIDIDTDMLACWKCNEASGALLDSVTGAVYSLSTLTGSEFTSESNIWEGTQSSRRPGSTTAIYGSTISGAGKTALDAILTSSGSFYCAFNFNTTDTDFILLQYGTSSTASSSSRISLMVEMENASNVIEVTYLDGAATNIVSSPFQIPDSDDFRSDKEFFLTVSWKPAESGTANKLDWFFFLSIVPQAGESTEAPMVLQGWVRDQEDMVPGSSNLTLRTSDNSTTSQPTYHEFGLLRYCAEEPTAHLMLRHMWPMYSDQIAFESNARQPYYRVRIRDGDQEWFDLGGNLYNLETHRQQNYVNSVEIQEDLDSDLATANISLIRDMFNLSLSPLMADSRLNLNAAGSFDPMLKFKREVMVEYTYDFLSNGYTDLAGSEKYAVTSPWQLLFHGRVEAIEFTDELINLTCVDNMSVVASTMQETSKNWGSSTVNAEDALQDLLDDLEPADGYLGGSQTLWVRDATSFALAPVDANSLTAVYEDSVLDAMNKVVYAYGAVIKYMYDSDRGTFRIAHYVPERDSPVSAYSFAPETVQEVTTTQIKGDNVKTKIIVRAAVGFNHDGSPKLTDRENDSAITTTARADYGTLTGIITSPFITSTAQADDLADAVAKDLSDTSLEIELQTAFFPWIEIGDFYTVEADNIRFSTNQDAAVYKYNHLMSPNGCLTNMVLQGNPKASRKKYGAGYGMFLPDTALPAPQNVSAMCNKEFQAIISWDALIASSTSSPGVSVSKYFVYGSTSSGFTPGTGNILGTVTGTTFTATGLTGDSLYYFKVIAVSGTGTPGSTSSEASCYVLADNPASSVVLSISKTGLTAVDGGTYMTADLARPIKTSNCTITVLHDPQGLFTASTGTFTVPSTAVLVTRTIKGTVTSATAGTWTDTKWATSHDSLPIGGRGLPVLYENQALPVNRTFNLNANEFCHLTRTDAVIKYAPTNLAAVTSFEINWYIFSSTGGQTPVYTNVAYSGVIVHVKFQGAGTAGVDVY